MKLINGKCCFYGGDINQDKTIDTGDMGTVDNDGAGFFTGYLSSDCNGDGTVDTGDMVIVDNGVGSFIGACFP